MKRKNGFILIEVIAVLVLVGILAALAGFGVVTGVQGYLMASENASITQKAQLAMTRLNREILECYDCQGSLGSITLPYNYENNLGNRRVDVGSGEVRIGQAGGDMHVLVDQVQSLTLERRDADGFMTITLTLNHRHGGGNQTFQTSILPRNIYE